MTSNAMPVSTKLHGHCAWLLVRKLNGSELSISYQRHQRVADIKGSIMNTYDIPEKRQTLLQGNRELLDHEYLNLGGVAAGGTIELDILISSVDLYVEVGFGLFPMCEEVPIELTRHITPEQWEQFLLRLPPFAKLHDYFSLRCYHRCKYAFRLYVIHMLVIFSINLYRLTNPFTHSFKWWEGNVRRVVWYIYACPFLIWVLVMVYAALAVLRRRQYLLKGHEQGTDTFSGRVSFLPEGDGRPRPWQVVMRYYPADPYLPQDRVDDAAVVPQPPRPPAQVVNTFTALLRSASSLEAVEDIETIVLPGQVEEP
mmetsp:Transcript_41294/g.74656  ORF Transcript_41294/g.74656 Transcript_41294/m.74656 type:complete len:312 (+) Transcript_41294:64-999(+)